MLFVPSTAFFLCMAFLPSRAIQSCLNSTLQLRRSSYMAITSDPSGKLITVYATELQLMQDSVAMMQCRVPPTTRRMRQRIML